MTADERADVEALRARTKILEIVLEGLLEDLELLARRVDRAESTLAAMIAAQRKAE